MTDLLTRLRAASEPSRELDAEIHAWVLQKPLKPESFGKRWVVATVGGELVKIPHYTSNLQDALELVPVDPETGEKVYALHGLGERTRANCFGIFVDKHHNPPNPALALATAAIEAQMKLREET